MNSPTLLLVAELVNETYSMAESGTIDNPSNIENDKVYLYSGTADTVVVPG